MALEDFTTYTEVDEGGDITVIANKITVTTMTRGMNSYVYKDFGAGYFTDFKHNIQINLTQLSNYGAGCYWGTSSGANHTYALKNTNNDGLLLYTYSSTGVAFFVLREMETNNIDSYTGAKNTDYYLTFERSGSTLTCKWYSDSARTNLIDTLSIVCPTTAQRYCQPFHSFDAPHTATISCVVDDLEFLPLVTGGSMQIMKYWGT